MQSAPPAAGDEVVIAVNPIAGSGRRARHAARLAEELSTRGLVVHVAHRLDDASERANRLHEEGRLRAVVAAGGDGTASELVNRTLPGVPLALLPLGTENLLARHVGVAPRVEAVAEVINAGRVVQLDAGRAEKRLFLLMASCGPDAEVVRRLHATRRGHIRKWSYAKPILATIRSYEYPRLRLYFDDAASEAHESTPPSAVSYWSLMFNLPAYGAGFGFAPQATARDGLLDVCSWQGRSLWKCIRFLGAVARKQHLPSDHCVMTRARSVRIESDQPVPYQLDGDPGGMLPCTFEVLPGRLSLLAPAGFLLES